MKASLTHLEVQFLLTFPASTILDCISFRRQNDASTSSEMTFFASHSPLSLFIFFFFPPFISFIICLDVSFSPSPSSRFPFCLISLFPSPLFFYLFSFSLSPFFLAAQGGSFVIGEMGFIETIEGERLVTKTIKKRKRKKTFLSLFLFLALYLFNFLKIEAVALLAWV